MEYLSVNYSGGSQFILGIITNDQGQIVAISEGDNNFNDFNSVCSEEELTFYALSYNNEITGVTVGNNIADIVGCHAFSNPLPLVTSNLQPFNLELTVDGQAVVNESLQICLLDGIIEILDFTTNATDGDLVYFVLDQFDDVALQIESSTTDLMGLEPGDYTIVAYNYEGTLYDSEGSFVNIEGCFQISDYDFVLTILGPQDGCSTASEDLSVIGLSLKSNLVSTTLDIENPENRQYTYRIFNLSGSNLLSGNSSTSIESIDVSTFPAGMNIVSFVVDGQQYRSRFIKQ
ncbi:MAG: hypothetical protein ACJATI_004760 [Halioglobus sp.]|jgi:hypothetical protein